jgi:uncharacterized protein (TIGR03067 family)
MIRFTIRDVWWTVVVLGVLSHVSAAATPGEKGLNGRWKCVIAMYGGKPVTDAVGEFAVFSDDRWVQQDRSGKVNNTGAVVIDWTKKPATIDVTDDSGNTNLGVIDLRGDSLEICWGFENRPQSLDSSKGKDFVHVIFARVPDE